MTALLGGLFWFALFFAFGARGVLSYLVAVCVLVAFHEVLASHYRGRR